MIQVNNINKNYQNTKVLTNFSLTLNQGESITILGASGSGKSTLLNILGGIDKANNGEIIVCNENISQFNEKELTKFRAKYLGFIYQLHHLLADFSTLENVCFPLIIQNIDKKKAIQLATEILTKIGLNDKLESLPSQLSGGQRQRVAIARAIVCKPKLILADEPTGNLDHENSIKVINLLLKMQKENNSSLVIVTHNKEIAKKTDRVFNF